MKERDKVKDENLKEGTTFQVKYNAE